MDEPSKSTSLSDRLRPWGQRATLLARHALRRAGPVLRGFWRMAKPVLSAAVQIVLALVILFEEWGWRPLSELLGRLARWRPWAHLEYGIARLPPYAALVVFVLPSTLLLPLKFLAVILVAKGQIVLAGLLFMAAKVVATALIARLFLLTQPALMQIGWFAWAYDTVMPWKEALTDRVRASWVWRVARVWKERARRLLVVQWRRWQPAVGELRAALAAAAARLRLATAHLARQIKERWAASQR